MSHIPPPSYAASIWITGEGICIGLPEAGTVIIPLDRFNPQANGHNRGLSVLINLLRKRQTTPQPFTRIGMPAAPIRYEVEQALASDEKYTAWLNSMNEAKAQTQAEKDEAKSLLEALGL